MSKRTYIVWVEMENGIKHIAIEGLVLSAELAAIKAKFGNIEKRKLNYKYKITIDTDGGM